ncbi:nuclear transport factor 2 family protein [Streptomyces marincola]|uniref:nuclear transport factor 2 family protein n=1 Tax=Streptomyces marincola TaxID=2878388 RepID=UPI001CF0D5BA|nr:nuclear transport factor 2 family protein [Streptomyces marincola]UCM90122.1 nuclear transport factor 2 family protein [Streptomyces marincola]
MDTAAVRIPGDTGHLDPAFLADRAAIQDLVVGFALYFDAGDFEGLAELLTEDACYEILSAPEGTPSLAVSREEIIRVMSGIWQHNLDTLRGFQRHVTTNVLVTRLDAEQAEARSLLTSTFAHEDGRHEVRRTGAYVDILRKRDGRWRLHHRRLHLRQVPSPAAAPASA